MWFFANGKSRTTPTGRWRWLRFPRPVGLTCHCVSEASLGWWLHAHRLLLAPAPEGRPTLCIPPQPTLCKLKTKFFFGVARFGFISAGHDRFETSNTWMNCWYRCCSAAATLPLCTLATACKASRGCQRDGVCVCVGPRPVTHTLPAFLHSLIASSVRVANNAFSPAIGCSTDTYSTSTPSLPRRLWARAPSPHLRASSVSRALVDRAVRSKCTSGFDVAHRTLLYVMNTRPAATQPMTGRVSGCLSGLITKRAAAIVDGGSGSARSNNDDNNDGQGRTMVVPRGDGEQSTAVTSTSSTPMYPATHVIYGRRRVLGQPARDDVQFTHTHHAAITCHAVHIPDSRRPHRRHSATHCTARNTPTRHTST